MSDAATAQPFADLRGQVLVITGATRGIVAASRTTSVRRAPASR